MHKADTSGVAQPLQDQASVFWPVVKPVPPNLYFLLRSCHLRYEQNRTFFGYHLIYLQVHRGLGAAKEFLRLSQTDLAGMDTAGDAEPPPPAVARSVAPESSREAGSPATPGHSMMPGATFLSLLQGRNTGATLQSAGPLPGTLQGPKPLHTSKISTCHDENAPTNSILLECPDPRKLVLGPHTNLVAHRHKRLT